MKENAIIRKFVRDQLSVWPLAADNFRALKEVIVKELTVNGLKVRLQYNPARIISTGADVSRKAISERPCFLCQENRPPEQHSLLFDGRKGRKYDILVNPYPIFPLHLTVASTSHEPQSIAGRYVDLLDLSHHYTDFTFFYNGPRCGASAPDHLHFQASSRGLMPLEREADRVMDMLAESLSGKGVPYGDEKVEILPQLASDVEYVASLQDAQVYHYRNFTHGVFFLRARTSKSMAKLFYRLLDCAPVAEGDTEPMFNLLTWYKCKDSVSSRPAGYTHGLAPFEYRAVVMFRARHRSSHYYSDGPDHLTISPGCADMAGLFIVPRKEDFDKADSRLIGEMLSEVSVDEKTEKEIIWRMTRTQPMVQVGIMEADEIAFEIISDGAGVQRVSYCNGKLSYNGVLYDELYFDARTPSSMFAEPTFILYGVTIGVDFHWQRQQDQKFAGALKFIAGNGKAVAINTIGVEDYLSSVISSEMKATAPLELLKAHAVISRSWLLAVMERRKSGQGRRKVEEAVPEATDEYIRWFDRDDHTLYDVCADDHCQRYQGLSSAVNPNVRAAIDSTWGQVLKYGGEICDARFSKCCGGRTEIFSTCWEDKDYPYLQSIPDTPGEDPDGEPFCANPSAEVLSSVLNDYDLETSDFYRWSVEYSREELSELIRSRSGIDFGEIVDLVPLDRGPSGRIWRLKVVGTKRTMVIGKELIIRKFLSSTHLKSSAFSIRWREDSEAQCLRPVRPFGASRIYLTGHGWGHGVGLCQIGAAVMASRGYTYKEILSHYYPGAQICQK